MLFALAMLACVAPEPGQTEETVAVIVDTSVEDTAVEDTAVEDTGVEDTGGQEDTGQADTGEVVVDEVHPPWLGLCGGWSSPSLSGLEDLRALDGEVEDLVDMGLVLVRPHRASGHVFAMNVVHPEPGRWDFTLSDHVVLAAQHAGARLMITLQPEARLDASTTFATSRVSAEDLDAWHGYVRVMVERYDGDGVSDMPGLEVPVYAWELGNEPRCAEGQTACMDEFLSTVRVGWQAAHRADSEALVMAGGAFPIFSPSNQVVRSQQQLWTHFFAHGGAEYTDVFSFHMGTGRERPGVLDYLDVWSKIVPAGLPIWLGESGPYSVNGQAMHPDPAQAAQRYVQELGLARTAGVQRGMYCLARQDLEDHPELEQALRAFASPGQ